ncbi:NAD(P)-dependent oxidoreductase [Myxococcota bacterium]|nr:NAD(P)-dependent oxidoreductase [Myxococcota bacterium]
MTQRIGMIGIGQIGSRIARCALGAGFEVCVSDVRPEAVAELVGEGALGCTTAAELSQKCEIVAVVVLDDAQLEQVVMGPNGILEGASPGSIIAIHSTVKTSTVRRVAEAAAERDVHVLDAGVAGGAPSAETGELVVMVGGDADALERARPLFESYARDVVHVGELGAGMKMKLIKNHLSYAVLASTHEAMLYTERAGIDFSVLRRVVDGTRLLDQFFNFTLARNGAERLGPDASAEELESALKYSAMAHKDLDAVLALAEELGVELPVAESSQRVAGRMFRVPVDSDG